MSVLKLTDIFFVLFLYNCAFPILFMKPLHASHKAKLQKFIGHSLSTWIIRPKYSFRKVFWEAAVGNHNHHQHVLCFQNCPIFCRTKTVQTKRWTRNLRTAASLLFRDQSCLKSCRVILMRKKCWKEGTRQSPHIFSEGISEVNVLTSAELEYFWFCTIFQILVHFIGNFFVMRQQSLAELPCIWGFPQSLVKIRNVHVS